MICTLLGFKSVDFENNDGEKIEGVKIFYAYPDDNTVGSVADSKFVKPSVFNNFAVTATTLADSIGECFDFDFDGKGKLVGLKRVD